MQTQVQQKYKYFLIEKHLNMSYGIWAFFSYGTITINVRKFQKLYAILFLPIFFFFFFLYIYSTKNTRWYCKQCRPRFQESLIWVFGNCICHYIRQAGVQNFSTFPIILPSLFQRIHNSISIWSTSILSNRDISSHVIQTEIIKRVLLHININPCHAE